MAADVAFEPPQLRAAGRIGFEEGFCQSQRAQRSRQRQPQLVPSTHDKLHAAAADIEDQAGLVVHGDRRAHRHVDEAAFFFGGNDARRDAGAQPRLLEEQPAVARLAHRRSRCAQNAIDAHAPRQLAEALECFDRAPHRGSLQQPGAERAAADLRHLPLAIHDLETTALGGAGDDHMDRVGADVDGGETHAGAP